VNKFRYPHCNEESVSFIRKLIISPIVSHKCSSCDKPITVPFKSIFLTLPSLLIILFGSNFFSVNIVIILFILSLVLTSYFHNKYVPLEKSKL
jgi:hypothetical protein